MRSTPHLAPLAQGIFYVGTGLWPILHLRSFEAITGPKADRWLVRTVGGLIAAVGLALVVGAFERRRSGALRILGIGSAVALAAADLIYVSQGTIPKVYLGDVAAEGAIVASWLATN